VLVVEDVYECARNVVIDAVLDEWLSFCVKLHAVQNDVLNCDWHVTSVAYWSCCVFKDVLMCD